MNTTIQKISQEIMDKNFWRKHYDIYKASALSKAAYIRQNNLIAPRFIYWSRKFEMSHVEKTKSSQSPNFARIEIKEEKSQSSAIALHPLCSIEFGNAKRLMIHDMAVIKMILNSLGVN